MNAMYFRIYISLQTIAETVGGNNTQIVRWQYCYSSRLGACLLEVFSGSLVDGLRGSKILWAKGCCFDAPTLAHPPSCIRSFITRFYTFIWCKIWLCLYISLWWRCTVCFTGTKAGSIAAVQSEQNAGIFSNLLHV